MKRFLLGSLGIVLILCVVVAAATMAGANSAQGSGGTFPPKKPPAGMRVEYPD